MPARTDRNSRVMTGDPFALALMPPPDETPEQREKRIREEEAAQKKSNEIDAQLKRDKSAAIAQKKKAVRVLLLGQSESGKSTMLKNFQLVWAPQSWREERASWRSVVHLNIVNSTLKMLSVLSSLPGPDAKPHDVPQASADLDKLSSQLSLAQKFLRRRFGPEVPSDYKDDSNTSDNIFTHEFFVRSDKSWKERLFTKRRRTSVDLRASMDLVEDDEARDILLAHKSTIIQLWSEAETQKMLHKAGLRLEESPGFFMDDLDRILVPDYVPSDDDVVRARLRTMGIQEYKFLLETGAESGREWKIYDVGGSRPQRASWFSFFDDVNAVIFLAPVSCFDEYLDEEDKVNRLEDSFELWKALCASPLLAKAQIILFLNKIDLLERKLNAGLPFARYVPSYGDRENTQEAVCRYLRNQFREIQKRSSTVEREFNAWLTCATDTKATEKTLGTVRYGIMKEHFAKADLF